MAQSIALELEKQIENSENKVLLYQQRIIEQKDKANSLVRRLENEAKELEEVRKEWLRKRNLEEERIKLELNELKKVHRHCIEDLRLKYERERENKLRDLKIQIKEKEKEIDEWQKKKSEEISKTLVEKAQIDARHQAKLSELLREEQAASRRGVVRQKRLLTSQNVFSMELERNQSTGLKKRPFQMRRIV